ncbi:MAG TPA: asparagine synthase (glutamine-hydrolyzing) [Puia sp.]|nr:asparagine synthase (glutamine-hydrolyzing) [Puia sp.]
MCGIAGIISINPNNITESRLKKMTGALAHRGPDGEGFWKNASANIGLGHRRLAIIDLGNNASQPMHYLDRYTIIHNGEIYNYIELKQEMLKKGYQFKTSSDTEVILATYDFYKEECVMHFDGMFAFAIWDEKEQMLFCARDRFGEKPFYYSFDQDRFLFASEAKGLWAAGVEKKINNPLLLNYLALGYAQTPVDKTITFYQEIFSLPPSHYLTLKFLGFTFDIHCYWDCDKEKQISISENEAIEKLQELFLMSVKKRLRSDVAIGTSLSGGIDSSSVVVSARELREGSFSQKTFSAIFPGFEKDESSFINIMNKKLHLENYATTPTADDLVYNFEKICYHQEMPFSSSSVFAQYKVSELAQKNNIKVLLDGQGADEIFGGYTKYIHWYLQELIKSKPAAGFRELILFKKNKTDFTWNRRNYLAAIFPAQTAIQLEKNEVKKILKNKDITESFKHQFLDRPSIYKPIVTKLNDMLYFNTFQMGLEELLVYADRNSMAHGIETRLPFLSHELVEFVFSLPAAFKIHNGFTKYILRKTFENKLPGEIIWRSEKIGFETPQKLWMQNPQLQDYIHEAKKMLVENKILQKHVLNKKSQPLDAYAADNFDWRYLVASRCIK